MLTVKQIKTQCMTERGKRHSFMSELYEGDYAIKNLQTYLDGKIDYLSI